MSLSIKHLCLLVCASAALWLGKPAYASMTYECNLYKNGQFIGTHIKVQANSREEAQRKAEERLRTDLKDRADSVQCK